MICCVQQGVWRALCVGAVYVCGVLIYLTQFPESLFPGAFDLAVRVWTIIGIAHLLAGSLPYSLTRP